jgi:putative ABC transport system ATP-binding protein
MAVIALSQIVKEYKMGEQSFKALDGVDLSINENDYLAIIGPSGSGKSTLMNIIGCLDVPTEGDYVLQGKPVAQMTETELAGQRNKSLALSFRALILFRAPLR